MTMLTTLAAAHPGWHDGGDAPAFWPIFPITFGLLWIAVLGGAFYLLRRRWTARAAAPAGPTAPKDDPLSGARTILAERFARGEIDEDEYHLRMSALRNGV
ncbi:MULTISPECIES: SHOCT domain-containing protein [Actinomadura]|uniref:SHOCT domain-containing protein n=1 Tax=Actinomadura yumaensis TaxID=111807 RepID=A0ABW2CFE8_9ACTN|nr:SHOCT domain-containing protein [Actinomadura sp. J1-007]